MTIEKSMIKAAVLEGLGCDVDDMREGVLRTLHMAQGSAGFSKIVLDKLQGLHAHVQKDVDEERCTPEEAQIRSKEINRCINFVKHLSEGLDTEVMMAKGRLAQADAFVKDLKKKHDAELSKVAAVETALRAGTIEVEDGQPTQVDPDQHRPTGVHPGSRLKQRRLAEAAAEAQAAQEPTPDEAPLAEPEAPQPAKAATTTKKAATKKKSTRKKSNGVKRGTAARSSRVRSD